MLDLPRYLLGVAEVLWLVGFATLGASAVRARLLPTFSAAPAHLATAVIAVALLIWTAELLGSFGLFEPVPYLVVVALVGVGLWLGLGGRQGGPSRLLGFSPGASAADRESGRGEKQDAAAREGPPYPPPEAQTHAHLGGLLVVLAAFVLAALAAVKFGMDVKPKLSTGMTGFDSTWYHGPFAAGFFQSGDTWSLHFIAPQFLAWFYPANAEIFHAAGMLAFDRDLLSPLLNLGWFVGCLVACWCIGRPYRVAPWSLSLGAVALSLPVLSDQAGEARNDIVGVFFLLAAVAIAVNAWGGRNNEQVRGERAEPVGFPVAELGPLAVAGLAAGLAAGTKLNFLLPAAVLVLGLAFLVPEGSRRGSRRWKAAAVGSLAALAGGGYWYLRNLAHADNPLPWFDELGPISLPAPDQALGGREGHSVLGYLFDGAVWSDWFLPGLHDGLTVLWPLLLALALAGLVLCLLAQRGREGDRAVAVAGLTGLAAIAAWLIAPTSASGPDGMPRGFQSGLRYLAPAIVLGLAVLPAALLPRVAWGGAPGKARRPVFRPTSAASKHMLPWRKTQQRPGVPPDDRTRGPIALGALAVLLTAIAIGYPVQRHYLENRYASPTFATPGLNAAFKWATPLSDARIATTSTRQYPLFGTDLSNRVQYVGERQSHGGFTAPTSCRQWRRLLAEGDYDYVITTRDRMEPGKPTYPESTRWTEGLGVEEVLRVPPTAVFKLKGPLDPVACR
jgi:hypothetical protein